MNCKQGDLAIVVKSHKGKNVGKIVTCLKFIGTHPNFDGFNDLWEVDQEMDWYHWLFGSIREKLVPDSCLKPLKGFPEEKDVAYKEKENV